MGPQLLCQSLERLTMTGVVLRIEQVGVNQFVSNGSCHRIPALVRKEFPGQHDRGRRLVFVFQQSGTAFGPLADLPI
jgi:hypothetical protein